MAEAQQSTPITPQVAMTLAAIASTGATPRPSGETLQAQTDRIKSGITRQLSNPLTKSWSPTWLALSPDNANMAYIVKNNDQIAVVIRGTNANVTDILEDLDVGTVVPFTASGSPSPISVSKGAMDAFTQIVDMRQIGSGTTLVQALAGLVTGVPQPTVYVIGHSLGGCIATMVALYLKAQTWQKSQPQFGVVTFAAPTAGLESFANYLTSQFGSMNQRYVNAYDVVPLAWADLPTAESWYPNPGPAATLDVKVLLGTIATLPGNNVYVQPGTAVTKNTDYMVRDDNLVKASLADFMGQVAFQHANSTYLRLLDAPALPEPPVVTGVIPSFGAARTQVTIKGSGFSKDSQVDFGPVPCQKPLTFNPDGSITAEVPDGTGIVNVYVTNPLGTSAAVPLGQFAYGGPEPVVVTNVTPDRGKANDSVTISGAGFAKGAAVHFGKNASPSVQVDTDKIVAKAPLSGKTTSTTVDITVTVNGYSSPSSPADEFTYTG
ncbi:lipase family protein [Streptomyces bugieae]|uniref:IPT/TIG domain-containing protein n=1 Tax=Streptomyces bugieae TaxID=3098223 RepID=A0ABU7NQV4_9ACTN|nr:IPT/TIG domain-containing protein [Streptomyces sp. DSM 41528]